MSGYFYSHLDPVVPVYWLTEDSSSLRGMGRQSRRDCRGGVLNPFITDVLVQGDKVELRGFGSFRIRRRNARQGHNPKTGSSISVPPKRVPFFKVGKRLRQLMNSHERRA